jgi:LmeA-like phospholipid-binding
MRKLLVVLVVLAALVFLGDSLLRGYAERRVAAELRSSLSLSETPSVDIAGWPFGLRVLAQSFPSVDISGKDVSIEGVAVTSFDLRLREVEFSASQLLSGDARSIDIASGGGSIRLTSELISERLGAQDLPFTFAIDGNQATISSPELGAEVSADVALSGNSLTIDPPGIDTISIELPRVAEQVTYRGVRVSGDAVVATFGLRGGRIDLTD